MVKIGKNGKVGGNGQQQQVDVREKPNNAQA